MADSATAAVAELLAAGAGGSAPGDPPDDRPLSDAEVEQRLSALDELLAQVEEIPGPAGELAVEAVAALAEVYGAALARATAYATGATGATGAPVVDAFAGDQLLGHLLALHGIHPDPVESRVGRALDAVRAEHGGEITLVGLTGGVAEVSITAGGGGCGCSSSAAGLEDVVRDAVLGVAPELVQVEAHRADEPRQATFIPLDTLLRPPPGGRTVP